MPAVGKVRRREASRLGAGRFLPLAPVLAAPLGRLLPLPISCAPAANQYRSLLFYFRRTCSPCYRAFCSLGRRQRGSLYQAYGGLDARQRRALSMHAGPGAGPGKVAAGRPGRRTPSPRGREPGRLVHRTRCPRLSKRTCAPATCDRLGSGEGKPEPRKPTTDVAWVPCGPGGDEVASRCLRGRAGGARLRSLEERSSAGARGRAGQFGGGALLKVELHRRPWYVSPKAISLSNLSALLHTRRNRAVVSLGTGRAGREAREGERSAKGGREEAMGAGSPRPGSLPGQGWGTQ